MVANLPKIKFFTVTKNEYDLIEDWILYHGALVGFENLIIIDNGSDNEQVLAIYKKYPVIVEVRPRFDGESQGEHFTEIMRKYRDNADWLVGLDTDEFIARNGNPVSLDKKDILQVYADIPTNIYYAMVNTYIHSVSDGQLNFQRPTIDINKFYKTDGGSQEYNGPMRGYNKAFYRAPNFYKTLNGNHDGETHPCCVPIRVPLVYFHFHDLGKERNLERAKQTVIGYKYLDGTEEREFAIQKLRGASSGYGGHRVVEYLEYLTNNQYRFNTKFNYETDIFKNHMLTLKG